MGTEGHSNKTSFFKSIFSMKPFKLMNIIQPEVIQELNTNSFQYQTLINE